MLRHHGSVARSGCELLLPVRGRPTGTASRRTFLSNHSLNFEPHSVMPQVRQLTSLNVGIVSVPIGTIAALALVPNDATIPGALFWSAWAMTLGLMGGLANDLFRRGPI